MKTFFFIRPHPTKILKKHLFYAIENAKINNKKHFLKTQRKQTRSIKEIQRRNNIKR